MNIEHETAVGLGWEKCFLVKFDCCVGMALWVTCVKECHEVLTCDFLVQLSAWV